MKRIFVADDDVDDITILTASLKQILNDVDIITAFSGTELFYNLENNTPPVPDFLFLDLNMPGKSGLQCLKQIKTHPFHKDTRVVILTTSTSPADIQSCYENGADYYMAKPHSFGDYRDCLLKIFNLQYGQRPSKNDFLINQLPDYA